MMLVYDLNWLWSLWSMQCSLENCSGSFGWYWTWTWTLAIMMNYNVRIHFNIHIHTMAYVSVHEFVLKCARQFIHTCGHGVIRGSLKQNITHPLLFSGWLHFLRFKKSGRSVGTVLMTLIVVSWGFSTVMLIGKGRKHHIIADCKLIFQNVTRILFFLVGCLEDIFVTFSDVDPKLI